MVGKKYDEHVRHMLDELAEHMRAAEEQPESANPSVSTEADASSESGGDAWSMPVVVTYEPPATRA